MKLKDTCFLKESYDKFRQHIKKQRHHFADKGPYSQSYDFSSSHLWMWELDHKEGWTPKNWCFWTVVLEKTLESPLDSKDMKPVSPKGNQTWVSIGRTDARVPILWHLKWRANSWDNTLMLGKIEGKRRGQQRMRWLDNICNSIDLYVRKLREIVKDRGAWGAAVYEVAKSWTWLSNWTTLIWTLPIERCWRDIKDAAAATAAESLQTCLTLCDPIDSSPSGSPILGILQERTLEWAAIAFSNAWKWKVKVKSLSPVWLFETLWTCGLPVSCVHGIFQARGLKWGAIAFSVSRMKGSLVFMVPVFSF